MTQYGEMLNSGLTTGILLTSPFLKFHAILTARRNWAFEFILNSETYKLSYMSVLPSVVWASCLMSKGRLLNGASSLLNRASCLLNVGRLVLGPVFFEASYLG